LLVVIHGGPTGIDLPEPTPTYVYPIMQWVEKGALVLRVNYRGSAGYGAKFRALNVRNLGVGDMWDVVSGVEYLNSKNMIDTSRMVVWAGARVDISLHFLPPIQICLKRSRWRRHF
jgi:dipeptidyl aminopeptidase/acylaminoacyl peptidase